MMLAHYCRDILEYQKMSDENDKIKHSMRNQQKQNHINRQAYIRKVHSFPDYGTPGDPADASPHRYHSAVRSKRSNGLHMEMIMKYDIIEIDLRATQLECI